jgi:hypothetical protein
MADTTPNDDSPRHQVFEAARHSAEWTIEQLWLHYVALAGKLVVFDLDGFLAGLIPMSPGQQDVLACALNERLADLNRDVRVPYLTVVPDWLGEHLLEETARLNSSQ